MTTNPIERRLDNHRQMLVDVGILLHRAYGDGHARMFLEEMAIAEQVIVRILVRDSMRQMMHITPIAADH